MSSKIIDFNKSEPIIEPPHLLDIQKDSFNNLMQLDKLPWNREDIGIESIFEKIFPIYDYNEDSYIEYISYSLGKPKFSLVECKKRGLSYTVPMKVKVRLFVRSRDKDDTHSVEDVREEEIFFCDFPLMTDRGTFIVNGSERVIVSQLHRSPGVIYQEKTLPTGRVLYFASIIPYRGSWLEFQTDSRNVIYFTIDKRRKLPVTILLRVLGFETDDKILDLFYEKKEISISSIDPSDERLIVLGENILTPDDEEIIIRVGSEITEDKLKVLKELGISEISIYEVGDDEPDKAILHTLKKDNTESPERALKTLYAVLRPGDVFNYESAKETFEDYFFDPRRYDLATVGRMKINKKFDLDIPSDRLTLHIDDITHTIKGLIELRLGERKVDDVDHLGNRRVRSVGELLYNQFQLGLTRVERNAQERMSVSDMSEAMPHDLVNPKPLQAVMNRFFGSSQLSQFLEQINPLAELTHKRRLSALGPGGLSRERAGFEVRDVHYTHYGRICPIETPEGPNIGLISSIAIYATINEYGLLETPYGKVKNGKLSEEIEYISADVEDNYTVAPSNAVDMSSSKLDDPLQARRQIDYPVVDADEVDYVDISPLQVVSVSSSLIPFLEHDDANRALMGSNMQRQALPITSCEVPLVSTGMEEKTARDSGMMVISDVKGEVVEVDSSMIKIKCDNSRGTDEELLEGLAEENKFKTYNLLKFNRSNQDSCINQKPLVKKGDKVKAGEVIADGPCTKDGKLALGENVLVAFMPWRGYNFEDAIVVSERLLKENKFESIHVEEYELECRDTKLGPEEITCDIPNVSSKAIKNLDVEGIIRIGAPVKPGDILIGKVTPKGETELLPEEKLLRAIFGDKSGDVKDSSRKAPPGLEGWVIDVDVYSRKEVHTKEERLKNTERIEKIEDNKEKEIKKLKEARDLALERLLVGLTPDVHMRDRETNDIIFEKETRITKNTFSKKLLLPIIEGRLYAGKDLSEKIDKILYTYQERVSELNATTEKQIEAIQIGDELPPGVIKYVKVYIARKRTLSIGDKLAGRHGNKGVISIIVPEEDMPYLPDGTPIDIILSPLSIPSRMNIGQLLETHLGWALNELGERAICPVFQSASEDEIKELLGEAGLPEDGKVDLYDGRTGEPFDEPIVVGYMYTMKLMHLADDKIHARSIGPYSLVTQQPLGGKSQMGGQRFGEMEVWALEAYGSAYTLQEISTVKSDDVVGRTRMYEAIVKGNTVPKPGIPESFNVLIRELRSLCLNIETKTKDEELDFEGIFESE